MQTGTFQAVGSGGGWMMTTLGVGGSVRIIRISEFASLVTFPSPSLVVAIQRLLEIRIRSGGFFWSLLNTTGFQASHSGYSWRGGPYQSSLRSRNGQLIFRYGMSFQPWALATSFTPGKSAEAWESPTSATV